MNDELIKSQMLELLLGAKLDFKKMFCDAFLDGHESIQEYIKYGEAFTKTPWRVYLLRCSDGSLYCGATTDMSRRFEQHQAGKASKYTRSRLPVELVSVTKLMKQGAALKLEAAVKKLAKNRKEEMLSLLKDEEFRFDDDN